MTPNFDEGTDKTHSIGVPGFMGGEMSEVNRGSGVMTAAKIVPCVPQFDDGLGGKHKSYLMAYCPKCTSEWGWNCPREQLEEFVANHKCVLEEGK
jgi:hypothetical protein